MERDLSFSVWVHDGYIILDVEARATFRPARSSGCPEKCWPDESEMQIERVSIDGKDLTPAEWAPWADEIDEAGWEAWSSDRLDPQGDADRRYDEAEERRMRVEDAIRRSREQQP